MQALRDACIKKLLPKVTTLKDQLARQLPEFGQVLDLGSLVQIRSPRGHPELTTAKWHGRPGLPLLHDDWCLKISPGSAPGERLPAGRGWTEEGAGQIGAAAAEDPAGSAVPERASARGHLGRGTRPGAGTRARS